MRVAASEDAGIVVWWATPTECVSALSRRSRAGLLDAAALTQGRIRLARLRAGWSEVAPTDDVRAVAERLLGVHLLRTADAFQLAAAIQWSGGVATGLSFVCLDVRLRDAAAREGFTLLPAMLTLM